MSDTADLSSYFEFAISGIEVTRRQVNIPGDSRIAWRLAVLCLLVRRGRANVLHLEQLHVLWWAIRSRAAGEILLRRMAGQGRPDELLVRFDPSLTTTVDLALGQGLVVVRDSGAVELTVTGVAYADDLLGQDDSLLTEKAFLNELPSRINSSAMQKLLEWK